MNKSEAIDQGFDEAFENDPCRKARVRIERELAPDTRPFDIAPDPWTVPSDLPF